MTCPAEVRAGEKFTIDNLPPNHAGWLLAITDGKTEYLLSLAPDAYEHLLSLAKVSKSNAPRLPISPADFGKMTKITIDTATIKGVPFKVIEDEEDDDGRMKSGRILGPARRIFTKSETYMVQVYQDDFRDAPGAMRDNCEVKFLSPVKNSTWLGCPVSVHLGEKFTVKDLPPHHEGWMFSVITRGSEFVVSFDSKIKSDLPPPIPPGEFGKLSEITIDPKTFRGIPIDTQAHKSIGPLQLLFTDAGFYEILVFSDYEKQPEKSCDVKVLAK